MAGLLPVAVYGLKIPSGDVMIPATVDFPATFRITMAAIDPSAAPEYTGNADEKKPVRSTLKLVYNPAGPDSDSDEDESEDEARLRALLGEPSDDESDEENEESSEDEDEDEDVSGGPSDPSKTKKARKEAAAQQLLKALAEDSDEESEEGMEVDEVPRVNGTTTKALKVNGKGKTIQNYDDGDAVDEDEDEDESTEELEELVVCTLDPDKNYQQPLDLTIPEGQDAYFKVSGTHTVYLTGNYVIPNEQESEEGMYPSIDDEDEYDLEPEEDELDDDDVSDELDDIEDPRVTEILSEEDEKAPALVKKEEAKKGKKKRQAEDSGDEPSNLDEIMAKSLKSDDKDVQGEQKLSKKQLKKLKKNDGKAVDATAETKPAKSEDAKEKSDKKVSFAKNLEQPPTSSQSKVNGDKKQETPKTGVKVVQGVKIDDRKVGSGPVAKKGDKVGMRYIGKLKDGKVFDANKKGPPFKFKLGEGSVIKGWDIGVAGMAVGGERRIIIPANLGYGNKGVPNIPANSELTFDIKMLEIL